MRQSEHHHHRHAIGPCGGGSGAYRPASSRHPPHTVALSVNLLCALAAPSVGDPHAGWHTHARALSSEGLGRLAWLGSVWQVVFGASGVLEGMGAGRAYVDMSTVDAHTSTKISEVRQKPP